MLSSGVLGRLEPLDVLDPLHKEEQRVPQVRLGVLATCGLAGSHFDQPVA